MRAILVASLLISTPVYACDPFPYCLGGGGSLHIEYCKPGVLYGESCTDVSAIAYGSVCFGPYAKDHAERLQTQYVGKEYTPKAWRCSNDSSWRSFDDAASDHPFSGNFAD